MTEGTLKRCLSLHPSRALHAPRRGCSLGPSARCAGRARASPTARIPEGSSLPSPCLTGDCSLFPLEHWCSKEGTICGEARPSPGHLHLPQLESSPSLSPWEIPRGVYESELAPSWLLWGLLSTGGDLGGREGHSWCALGHPRPPAPGSQLGQS